ncbi:hypothetical protein O6H91_19G003700 [Diphasiastrum complanatum]|uniref:Uncharacterized protein n=1 Tax=Diphasiastrum complanatum TaxID=34168 RepID=A0ACC2ASA5_DIPCM|nr:hypothetical protein O6H91_19G003700 [Diphasiastrum complanatum]
MATAILWAAVVGLVTTVLLFVRKWRNQGNNVKGLPKGSLGFIPWLGETIEFMYYFSTSNPEPFVNRRIAKYGKVFTSHLFGKPTIISTDAEFNKFVMQNDKRLFNMGYPTSFAEILGSYDMLMVNGDMHKKMRGYAMTFLNSKQLQDYLLNDIENYVLLTLRNWKGRVVNVQDEAKAYTFRVVAKQLISFDPGEESDSLMKEYYQLFEGIFSLPLKIPGSKYVKAIAGRRRILKRLAQVIDSRKTLEEDNHKDLLATVFSEKLEDRMTNEQIMDYFLGLLSAGHVSTATAILFAIAFLTECPKALNQLREENLAVKKNQKGEKLTWDDYKNSMPFTIDVVYETLRLTNVSHGLYRKAIEDVHYQGTKRRSGDGIQK